MNQLVADVATLGLVLLGLSVLVGKITPDDALTRIGMFVLVLAIAPFVVCQLNAILPTMLKPALLILAALVIVTDLVRMQLSMFS